jgi:hypothetical protein
MPPSFQQEPITYPGDGLPELPEIPRFIKIILLFIIIIGIVLVTAARAAVLSCENWDNTEEDAASRKVKKHLKTNTKGSDETASLLFRRDETQSSRYQDSYRTASTASLYSPSATGVDFPLKSPAYPARWRGATPAPSPIGENFQLLSPTVTEAGSSVISGPSRRAPGERLLPRADKTSSTVDSNSVASGLGRVTGGIVERIGTGLVNWVRDEGGEKGLVLPVTEDDRNDEQDI